ncbi:MAG TPA: ATP-binding cassette domain-containing protein [Gemmatimonadales bacterium]|nr:ATP-binding cassette domain-containing protein [Gemmatimonadales bacterium]
MDQAPMPPPPEDALLDVQALGCTIGERHLWGGVSFTVRPGESLAVTGPSGSGKTQLLRTLAGLARPTAGSIRLDQRPIDEWPMPEYRARVVLVPQRPSLPEGTVAAALADPFRLRVHQDKRFSLEQVHRYLTALDMGEAFLEQRTEELSGGETQLVATLRAVLIEPVILLLDEPTASLDAGRAERIETLVSGWLGGGGRRAWLWTTHDADQITRMSDRTIALGDR